MSVVTRGPAEPVAVPPSRRPGSVRRTSTTMMFWPNGFDAELHLKGRARDLLTPEHGDASVVATAELFAVTGRTRDVQRIEANPSIAGLERLIGCRAGGNLRKAISEQFPQEVENGTPLHLLLDDLAGATLIAGYTLFKWADEFVGLRERLESSQTRDMRGICSGFRDGSSALRPDGSLLGVSENTPVAPSLADVSDPLSWHELDVPPRIAMRRARRIDLWHVGERVEFDTMFRDSCWTPAEREEVLHEYQILGSANRVSGELLTVTAVPRVLPYVECPGAAPHAARMAGTALPAMRREVLDCLRSTECCTHLNDGLRSLAEVPVLARSLAA